MSYAFDILASLEAALIEDGLNCDVGKPKAETQRPYIILNFIPVNIGESSLTGGTQIQDLYITMTSVGANRAQSIKAMKRALDVVSSSWNEPALLGPPEHSPGAHLPQEEGTWRTDSTVRLRMQ